MRLIVARCEVTYSGRLNAFLPESTRLLMVKDDGAVLVHADAGGYKPLNSDLSIGSRNRRLTARRGPTCGTPESRPLPGRR
jgi:RecB family endonuclease NucS